MAEDTAIEIPPDVAAAAKMAGWPEDLIRQALQMGGDPKDLVRYMSMGVTADQAR